MSLDHGDFWPGQVLMMGTRPIFIDWSDSSVTHPFFSLTYFYDITEMEGYLPDVSDLRVRLRNAYLGPWTIFEPMHRLLEAFELSRPLSALHSALLYHDRILPNIRQRWEMHYMPSFFLKKLLHTTRDATTV